MNNDLAMIGKPVKDMYGTSMGKIIGTFSDVDGSIQTVGIDCGVQGLQQIPYEQLVVQDDVVIFIPKWRLDSQRLLREKNLTLRRLKALIDIVSENDEMKQDAELIHEKYKAKLLSLEETEQEIKTKLESRLAELEEQMKAVRTLIFDARVQFKSNEISETAFEAVKTHTTDLIEHITHETAEISNVQRRMADLNMEVQQILEPPKQQLQESAVSYLKPESDIETKLPPVPTQEDGSELESSPSPDPQTGQTDPAEVSPIQASSPSESEWLSKMEAH